MRRGKPQPPPPVTGKTLVRKMPFGMMNEVCQILDSGSTVATDWRGLASRILKKDGSDRYSQLRVRQFEMVIRAGKSPSFELLSDWGTTNCTVQELVDKLRDMEMLSAIDIIFPPEDEMEKEPPASPGVVVHQGEAYKSFTTDKDLTSPMSNLTVSSSEDVHQAQTRLQGEYEVSSTTKKQPCESGFDPVEQSDLPRMPLPSDAVQEYKYCDLEGMTDRFNELPVSKGGTQIGEGGFGTVFIGTFGGNNQFCAVKRLKMDIVNDKLIKRQFTAEHTTLSKLQHVNLVHLYGYSSDGPSFCLIFQYLVNGSLNARLACENDTAPLDWRTRVSIAQGSAQGICFLHQNGYIHRDIKSANILLDENLVAKIGDFGLSKLMPEGNITSAQTTNIIGSAVYMPPEAQYGEVSIKFDAYSFGVVLLEIMTGVPAVCEERENPDIITHVKYKTEAEQIEFIKLMDSRMEHSFGEESVRKMYDCATRLLDDMKQRRPELRAVMDTLMEC